MHFQLKFLFWILNSSNDLLNNYRSCLFDVSSVVSAVGNHSGQISATTPCPRQGHWATIGWRNEGFCVLQLLCNNKKHVLFQIPLMSEGMWHVLPDFTFPCSLLQFCPWLLLVCHLASRHWFSVQCPPVASYFSSSI